MRLIIDWEEASEGSRERARVYVWRVVVCRVCKHTMQGLLECDLTATPARHGRLARVGHGERLRQGTGVGRPTRFALRQGAVLAVAGLHVVLPAVRAMMGHWSQRRPTLQPTLLLASASASSAALAALLRLIQSRVLH